MRQLSTYLPEDVYTTMTSLVGEGESVNGYVRAAVEAENRRRLFTTTIRDIPTEVRLSKDDGLQLECAANFDNVFTRHRSRSSNGSPG